MTSNQPMTADKFLRWVAAHSPTLEQKQERRQRAIADAAADCLYKGMRTQGVSINVAGDDLIDRFPSGAPDGRTPWTVGELQAALVSLGWQPKRSRGEGGGA